MEILLVEALVKLLSGSALEGRIPQEKEWLCYRLAEDGLTIQCQGEPVPLELLMEMIWREPVKTPDQWVTEAKALIAMGATLVDSETLAGVLAKVSDLEAEHTAALNTKTDSKDPFVDDKYYMYRLTPK